jgi:hypothetical protein
MTIDQPLTLDEGGHGDRVLAAVESSGSMVSVSR